jgi:hypothetical protein
MLFILVMDKSFKGRSFATSFLQATQAPYFPLCGQRGGVLEAKAADIRLITDLLKLFGEASGLHTNFQKSSVVPIRCDSPIVEAAKDFLPCKFVEFPCRYLGLPLSIKKLSTVQVQGIIDRVASSLPGWMAELMNRARRAVHAQFVMTAKIIYTAIALDLPLWAIKAIEKSLRAFLWKGRKKINGGHCLLAWAKVARPKELGGLGLFDIRNLSWALRARWPWLQLTEPDRPWNQFQIQVPKEVQSLFDMAVLTQVGDGSNARFWTDRWLNGKRIRDVAPAIYALVPKGIRNSRLVRDALINLRFSWCPVGSSSSRLP